MSDVITREILQSTLRHSIKKLQFCTTEFNELDAFLGDGDMGSTLASICRELDWIVDELPTEVSECFKKIAMAIAKTSGSSLSAVIMTGFMHVSQITRGRKAVYNSEMPGLLDGAIEAMSKRGGAVLGDKTILDGLDAIACAIESLPNVDRIAVMEQAITQALDKYREKPSKVGRARLAGERSIGQDDPGMVVLKRVIEAIAEGRS